VSKRLLCWVGGVFAIVGIAVTIVFVAWPNPYRSTIAYLPPPSWHEDGIQVGYSLFGLGLLMLVITQLIRSGD
jgi:ABC-type antimicrobial peptide transport system permease subunit